MKTVMTKIVMNHNMLIVITKFCFLWICYVFFFLNKQERCDYYTKKKTKGAENSASSKFGKVCGVTKLCRDSQIFQLGRGVILG